MSKKLFGLDAPPARDKLRVEIKKELLAELDDFHEFVKEEEGEHVEMGHVIEYILESAYFGSARKEVREYGKWKEEKYSQGKGVAAEPDIQEQRSSAESKADSEGDGQTDKPSEMKPKVDASKAIAGARKEPVQRVVER